MGEMADLAMDGMFDSDEFFDNDFDFPFLGRRVFVKPKRDEWVTLKREVIKIKNLETSHLCNILNYITRTKRNRKVGGERMIRLRNEARKRGLVRETDGSWREAVDFDVVEL